MSEKLEVCPSGADNVDTVEAAFDRWWDEPEGYGYRFERAKDETDAAWMAWQAQQEKINRLNAALLAAERRGRAKGMREAAEIADKLGGEFVAKRERGRIGEHSWDFYNGAVLGADETRNAIRTRADAIERGE